MTLKGLILDVFKDKDEWTLIELYAKMPEKAQSAIRGSVNSLTKKSKLERIKKGTYKLKQI